MKLMDDSIEGGLEVAAKAVKLASSDWRKLALFLILLICATSTLAYQLANVVARSEVERLNAMDAQLIHKAEMDDARIKRLEDAQADIAVLKNDVAWIRRELERR